MGPPHFTHMHGCAALSVATREFAPRRWRQCDNRLFTACLGRIFKMVLSRNACQFVMRQHHEYCSNEQKSALSAAYPLVSMRAARS